MVNKGKTITINLDSKATGNHFQGQPIYRVVESMKDSTGNEMLKAQQQAVQRTEKATNQLIYFSTAVLVSAFG
jgi:hypothetical protein